MDQSILVAHYRIQNLKAKKIYIYHLMTSFPSYSVGHLLLGIWCKLTHIRPYIVLENYWLNNEPVWTLILLCMNVGPQGLPATTLRGLLAAAWPAPFHSLPSGCVRQWPPCRESSLPRLPISTPPIGLDECVFFISLVVRLPCSSIFCQFWLFSVFKLLLSFFWLCEEAQCVHLCLHLGWKQQVKFW